MAGDIDYGNMSLKVDQGNIILEKINIVKVAPHGSSARLDKISLASRSLLLVIFKLTVLMSICQLVP